MNRPPLNAGVPAASEAAFRRRLDSREVAAPAAETVVSTE